MMRCPKLKIIPDEEKNIEEIARSIPLQIIYTSGTSKSIDICKNQIACPVYATGWALLQLFDTHVLPGTALGREFYGIQLEDLPLLQRLARTVTCRY